MTYSAKYDVYGAVRGVRGTATTAQGFVGGLGHLSEAATGLIYMRARYYDPNIGRFVSEDSKCNGINWYVYCSNNPINRIDYSGKDDMADTVEAMADEMGLDTSDMGFKQIDADIYQNGNKMDVIVNWVEKQQGGSIDYKAFMDALTAYAKQYGCTSAMIGGVIGSPGGTAFFKACLQALGDAGQLTQDSDATWVYWTMQ